MTRPKSKAAMMRALRRDRKQRGLERVTCYVKAVHRKRLQRYVTETLKGETGS